MQDAIQHVELTGKYHPREAVLGALTNLQSEQPQRWESEGWLQALRDAADLIPKPPGPGRMPLDFRGVKLPGRRVMMARDVGGYVLAFKTLEDRKARTVRRTFLALSGEAMFSVVYLYLKQYLEPDELAALADRLDKADAVDSTDE